jgi:hypothetical protein
MKIDEAFRIADSMRKEVWTKRFTVDWGNVEDGKTKGTS